MVTSFDMLLPPALKSSLFLNPDRALDKALQGRSPTSDMRRIGGK